MYHYQINQFDVESDIELPCDLRCRRSREYQDLAPLRVRVRRHSLEEFPQVEYVMRRFGGAMRIYHVGTGTLLCCEHIMMHVDNGGRTITLDIEDEYAPLGALYAIAIGMGICTLLRGDIPLHAAGVEIDGKVIALMAESGTGKSTTSRALLHAGARFVSDDVVVARLESDGIVTGFPAISLHAKANREALRREGRDYRQYEPVNEMYEGPDDECEIKYWDPVAPEGRVLEAKSLSALYVLQPVPPLETPQPVIAKRAGGVSMITLLIENTMGYNAARALIKEGDLLKRYMGLVTRLPIYTLEYPKRYEALPEVIQAIRETLGTAENVAAPVFRTESVPAATLVA
jgi:hypothetical protein